MHYHIVGIGGAGMSAIAHILLDQGHTVSGSDMQASRQTHVLVNRGATVYTGHNAAYVAGADAVLATAAAARDHVELVAAHDASIPVLKRSDLWREWSQQRPIIAVAGTHGKTTTSAMIAFIFEVAGREPGFLIGSDVPDLGSSAHWGNPVAPMIIEADEYDHAFLALHPQMAVVTNVEWDHPDIYPSDDEYQQTFATFASQVEGLIVTCGDEGTLGAWAAGLHSSRVPLITYGIEEQNDYCARLLTESGLPQYQVVQKKGARVLVQSNNGGNWQSLLITLGVPGLHNVRNSLAALVVAGASGIAPETAADALARFRGTARRFERRGEVNGITVTDDYAHHPTEVAATLHAARSYAGGRRVIAYVQPHTYTRTELLLSAWAKVFAHADVVLVGNIYPARETRPAGSEVALAQQVVRGAAAWHRDVRYAGTIDEATALLHELVQPGDFVLTMGAGDSVRVGEMLLEQLQEAQA